MLIAFVLGALAGAMGLVLLRDATEPVPGVNPTPSPAVSLVGTASTDQRQSVQIIESWSAAATVMSGPLSGRVTAITSANSLETGDTVIEISGRERVALAAARPLWRELAIDVAGTDVTAVAEMLYKLGFLSSPDEVSIVDDRFVAAVRRFERARGWQQSGIFKPDYSVWLPWEPFEIAHAVPTVNSHLPPDSALFIEEPRLLSVSFASIGSDAPLVLPEGPLVLEIPGILTVEVTSEGRIEAPDALRALARHLIEQDDSANNAASQFGIPKINTGILRLSSPRRLQTVATSAVIVSPTGRTCVVTEDNTVEPVEVAGGFGGVTEIEVSLDPAVKLLLDPSPAEHLC